MGPFSLSASSRQFRPCVAPEVAPRTRPVADRKHIQVVIELVAQASNVPAVEIRSPRRNHARAARARQVAMYLAYVTWQWPLARIGTAFDRDRTTVGYACRLIEDMRDDPVFDAWLERLEGCIKGVPLALEGALELKMARIVVPFEARGLTMGVL